MRLSTKSFITVTALGALVACKPKLKEPSPDKGSLDVSRYVSIGNSITSGYADGALYYDGQKVSYAALIAEQFKTIGGGDFKIPYVPQSSAGVALGGGFPPAVTARFSLQYATDCLGATSLMPVALSPTENFSFFGNNIYASQGPFNNMGVPGARSFHVAYKGFGNFFNASTGNYNPFYQRMASNVTSSSILGDAEAQNPTFFSVFIGNNDVLGYALSGGASDSITSYNHFCASIDTIIEHLTKNGAKGVIGNIPDVTTIPHFTTIPYNGLTLTQAQADQLNATTSGIFGFHAGPNAFIIEDASAPVGARPMKADELLLLELPLDSVKCHYMGALTPIPNRYVLTENEIAAIRSATNAFNGKIYLTAKAKGLAFVDVNRFMQNAKAGIVYNGVTVNAEFVKGGAFSLDGIHLNPLGNAMLANEFIKAINLEFGSTIPWVDVTKYRGTIFP
ncbi:MAG: hypothetical protein JST26_01805 [Bacteroidetes bacterium]|nr:hypothetical protein [Bacteroidota bacterium]